MKLFIKNMVCPRCIMAVRTTLLSMGLQVKNVELGEAEIEGALDESMRKRLSVALNELGFELLDDPRIQLVEQIRLAVIAWVRLTDEHPKLSDYLSQLTHKDYSTLSKLFSEVRGVTIERFAILHRIEYAKELLRYSQHTSSEIAYTLGYSSQAHFSAQFKQVTGMTPKEFRKMKANRRISLTDI